MNRQIVEYQTVWGLDNYLDESLDEKINLLLQKGWELYGAPYAIVLESSGKNKMLQAMVLRDDSEEEDEFEPCGNPDCGV